MAELTEKMDQAVRAMAGKAGKYLTFTLAEEDYGIEIRKIKEIIGVIPVTTVPQTPQFVKGVINLRGKVIPIMDLRARFGMPAVECTERTCIIVVEMANQAGTVIIGVVVDTVSEVLNIRADAIEPPPTFGHRLSTDYILGMAKMEGGVKILIDIDQVMGADVIQTLEKVA